MPQTHLQETFHHRTRMRVAERASQPQQPQDQKTRTSHDPPLIPHPMSPLHNRSLTHPQPRSQIAKHNLPGRTSTKQTLLSHRIWHTYLSRENAVRMHGEDTRHTQAEALVHQKTWGEGSGKRDMHRSPDPTKNLLQLVATILGRRPRTPPHRQTQNRKQNLQNHPGSRSRGDPSTS